MIVAQILEEAEWSKLFWTYTNAHQKRIKAAIRKGRNLQNYLPSLAGTDGSPRKK